MEKAIVKLTYIQGLKEVVLDELFVTDMEVIESFQDFLYCSGVKHILHLVELRSVTGVYLVEKGEELNPYYLSKHKSIIGKLIENVLKISPHTFKTFSLSCAGSDSKEVKEIEEYIASTFKLIKAEEADLKLFIGKSGDVWEVGASLTARPLTMRPYKVLHLLGALNPTIAYAMNTFCDLADKKSYLNIFSGSATLLIEAGISNPNLVLKGFDIDGKRIAESVKNIKAAGLIKDIELVRADIFSDPELGSFDVITSDLPFGMQISKGDDLEKLYSKFVSYSEEHLEKEGRLVVYTTEHELLSGLLRVSKFRIEKEVSLKVVASVGSYLYPKIFVCSFR